MLILVNSQMNILRMKINLEGISFSFLFSFFYLFPYQITTNNRARLISFILFCTIPTASSITLFFFVCNFILFSRSLLSFIFGWIYLLAIKRDFRNARLLTQKTKKNQTRINKQQPHIRAISYSRNFIIIVIMIIVSSPSLI